MSRTSTWLNYYWIRKKPFYWYNFDWLKRHLTHHQILIKKKMKYLGFSKNVIAWFKFRERKFKINISTSYSSSYIKPNIRRFTKDPWSDDTCIVYINVTEIANQLLWDFSSSSFCVTIVRPRKSKINFIWY